MAFPVYSTVFAGGNSSTAGIHALYVVPAGKIAVLRDLDLISLAAGATVSFLVDFASSSPYVSFQSTAVLTSFTWRGRQVYVAGDSIALQINSGTWGYRLSGYLLTA